MGTLTRAAIGLPPPLHLEEELSMALDVLPSFSSMSAAPSENPSTPDDDSESILYVNTVPSIPEATKELIKLQKDNEFSSSFWTAKAAHAADLKIAEGKLPQGDDNDSRTKRINYRIRVIESAVQHSAWISSRAVAHASKKFTVAKDELHAEIIKTVLSGLLLPPKVEPAFERVLTSISDGLKKTKEHTAEQQKLVAITTYRYDPVMNKVFAGIRTLYFTVTQALKDYNNSKNDKGKNADLELNYQQSDYNFNESVWDAMAGDVIAFVTDKGGITKPIDIPV